MQITIEIAPHVEAELARQASARGIELSAYVGMLLEEIARRRQPSRTMAEFEQTLDRIARFSDEIPALPDEAFSRESIYRDHD